MITVYKTKLRLPLALLLSLGVTAAGCDSVFEVDNPNELVQADLQTPEAASALVNGAEATVARGLSQIYLPYAVASDELEAIGSYDAGKELDRGFLTNPVNEFTNVAFPYIAEGRFQADEAIRLLESFDAEGRLRSRADLARAYLYGGIAYAAVGDIFDDFVISDRKQASPPIGEENMIRVFDQAIEYLGKGLEIARSTGRRDLEVALLAQRARVRHGRAVWERLNPKGQTPAQPLVADAGAVADAEAALQLLPEPDWKLRFEYSAATVRSQLGAWVNIRQEFRVGSEYVTHKVDAKQVAGILLTDPIDGTPAPALESNVWEFVNGDEYPPLTVVSARELHLILAEAALAGEDEEGAIRHLNHVRALDDLTPVQEPAALVDLLQHSRRTNLFLQGRRLADQYRFGERDERWQQTSDAVQTPGTFLPIAQVERISNCHIAGTC